VYPQVLVAMRNKFPCAAAAYGTGTFYHQVFSSQVTPRKGVGTPEYDAGHCGRGSGRCRHRPVARL